MQQCPSVTRWFKSARSTGAKECVEVAFFDSESVGIRDSKNKRGPHHTFTGAQWDTFVAALNQGFGDLPA